MEKTNRTNVEKHEETYNLPKRIISPNTKVKVLRGRRKGDQ